MSDRLAWIPGPRHDRLLCARRRRLDWIVVSAFALAGQSPQELLAAGPGGSGDASTRATNPEAPTASSYNLFCRAQFELGAWDAGIPSCEKAAELAPNNGLYHLWLGRIYGEKGGSHEIFQGGSGMAKKVHSEFEHAVEFSPDSWEARTDLAEFYVEAPGIVGGGEDKARAEAEQIAPLNPAMAHWVRGRIAEKNKDVATAEQEYRAAIDVSHGGARAWLNLAGFYSHNSRFEDMDRALHTLESSPLDHAAALVDGAGILFRTRRESPLAIRLLRRYLTSGPVEEWPAFKAHNMLGEFLERQGDAPRPPPNIARHYLWRIPSPTLRKTCSASAADIERTSVNTRAFAIL